MKNIYLSILDLLSENFSFVLATVTKTLGSTPQKPGSSALIGIYGLITGTVGGGIVEGKVLKIASGLLNTGNSGYYSFNLYNDISNTEEAICGGQISVLIDSVPDKDIVHFNKMKEDLAGRTPGVMITIVTGLSEELVDIKRYWISKKNKPDLPSSIKGKIETSAFNIIAGGKVSDFREMELTSFESERPLLIFLEPVFPSAQLVIAGAGHIGRALAHLGVLIGFEVTVIDERPEFANHENIPDADHILVERIGDAIKSIIAKINCYVVIVTRGHSDDAAALKACIGTDLHYIGMIGSKKKIGAMKNSFLENEWATEEQWNKVHAPIGIEIKSQTVEEIAVSIAAQLIEVRNNVEVNF